MPIFWNHTGTDERGMDLVDGELAGVRVTGLDDLPQEGPLIIAANHLSNADPPFIGGWLRNSPVTCCIVLYGPGMGTRWSKPW